jgi:LuxR family maltose regulon positive regulatory protein
VEYFEKGRYYQQQSDYVIRGSMSSVSLGSYVCRVGSPDREEMEQFIQAITRAAVLTAACMGGCMYGVDSLARAELALYQGDLGDAEALSREALRKAREQGQYEIENRALFFLLRICLSRGDYPGLQDALRQFENQLEQAEYQHRYTHYDIAIGWFRVQIGQPAKLASWLKNDFEESDLNTLANGWEILVKAKYHLTEKRCPAALAALESAGERNGPSVFILGRVETLALKAVCSYQLRDKEEAYGALREAWEQAQINGIVLPFMELGKDMRTLAEAAQKDRAAGIPPDWLEQVRLKASAYAKKLFALGEQFKPSDPKRNAPGVPLSRRELAVLTGLSQGLTREEIAKASEISVNTVKSVIRSVYNKLGAINRADAVRIATASGLWSGNEGGDDAGAG